MGDTELAMLEPGTSGWTDAVYQAIPPYLTQWLYTAIDPALAVDLWYGTIGFRVFRRDDRVEARDR